MAVTIHRPINRADLRTTATKGEHTFTCNAHIYSGGDIRASAYRYETEVCSLGEKHVRTIYGDMSGMVARTATAWVLTTVDGRATKHSTRRALLNRAIRYALADVKSTAERAAK